jgi:hypothetical protein
MTIEFAKYLPTVRCYKGLAALRQNILHLLPIQIYVILRRHTPGNIIRNPHVRVPLTKCCDYFVVSSHLLGQMVYLFFTALDLIPNCLNAGGTCHFRGKDSVTPNICWRDLLNSVNYGLDL